MSLEKLDPEAYAALLEAANGREIELLGCGSNRCTYWVVGRNIVLKVNYGGYAPLSNRAEADLWKGTAGHSSRKRLAPCRLLKNGVLVMRLVEPARPPDTKTADWACYVDGGQGGYYRGRWVLYDYGHELYRYDEDDISTGRYRNRAWYLEAV